MQLTWMSPFPILLQGRGLITNFLPSIFPVFPWKQFLCSSKIHMSSRPLLGAENTPFFYLVEESPMCGYQYSNNPPPLLLVLSWCGKSSGPQATLSCMVNQYSAGTQRPAPDYRVTWQLWLYAWPFFIRCILWSFYCLVALLSRICWTLSFGWKKWRFFFLKNRRGSKTLKYKLKIIYNISSSIVVSAFPGMGKLRNGIYQHEATSLQWDPWV